MAGEIVYLKAERNVEVKDDDVFLKDIAKVYCVNIAVYCSQGKSDKSAPLCRTGVKKAGAGHFKINRNDSAGMPQCDGGKSGGNGCTGGAGQCR